MNDKYKSIEEQYQDAIADILSNCYSTEITRCPNPDCIQCAHPEYDGICEWHLQQHLNRQNEK